MAMLALSDPAPLRFPRRAGLRPFVLGIYTSHYLFVNLLAGPENPVTTLPGWDLALVAVMFALPLALTDLSARFARTRLLAPCTWRRANGRPLPAICTTIAPCVDDLTKARRRATTPT